MFCLVPLLLLAVRDAHDACLWLKAAGFPQYVHMFEGKQLIAKIIINTHLQPGHSHDKNCMTFFLHRWSVSHQPFQVSSGKGPLLSRTVCLRCTHQVCTYVIICS